MAFTYITLTAGSGFRTATGDSVALPRIRARPHVDMVNGVEIVNQEVILPLDNSGTATKTLAATTDPATLPAGNYYHFTVEAAGYPVRQFIAALPHNAGSTLDVASLTALVAPPDLVSSGTFVLADATDVASTTPTDGQVLTYDTGTLLWGPEPAAGGGGGIAATIVDAKGDLIAATAADAVARLAVGANGLALVAASGQTTGLQWAAPAPAAHVHAGTDLTTGTVPTARLGSGTASSSSFLRGDQTWATPATGGAAANTISGVFNAKLDYAAAGNGSTNDATALQNALTAAGAAGGGVVYLPPGTYMTAKYLTIPSNVTLMGAGMGVTTIKAASTLRSAGGVAPDGGGYSVLQATGVTRTNIAIQDLTVDGNESADRAGLAASGVRLNSYLVDMRSVAGLRIERVATRNTWTYNIVAIDCSKFVVSGCDVRDPGTTGTYTELDGIHIWGSNQGRIIGNYVDNGIGGDADDAMVAHVFPGGNSCYDLVYAHNVCRGGINGNGMQLAGASGGGIRDITISHNVFWGCVSGFRTGFYSASSNVAIRSVTVANNTFRDGTTSPPIRLAADNDGQWEDFTITGNTIDGYGTSGSHFTYGIVAEGGNSSGELAITGNTLRNGYARGIVINGVRDYVVGQNIVDTKAAQDDPVAIILNGGSRDGVVTGNVITGRSTANGLGIYMESPASPVATNQTITGNRIRVFSTGVSISNGAGANPTNTLFVANNTQGNGSGTGFGTATVTSANNL